VIAELSKTGGADIQSKMSGIVVVVVVYLIRRYRMRILD